MALRQGLKMHAEHSDGVRLPRAAWTVQVKEKLLRGLGRQSTTMMHDEVVERPLFGRQGIRGFRGLGARK
jgi:hypothetical protein